MEIVSRAEWGARLPKRPPSRIALPTPRLWLHHTAVEWHGVAGARKTQAFHMDGRGWTDVGYSFLVDDDGSVYEGRGAGVHGSHTKGDNAGSHAISCMGDFSRREPPHAMLDAVADLVVHGHREGWWPDRITGGHRQALGAQTSCPGDQLFARIADLNLEIALRMVPGAEPPDDEEDLMAASDDIAEILRLVQGINPRIVDDPAKGHVSNLTKTLNAARAAATRTGDNVDIQALAAALREDLGDSVVRALAAELAD